MVVRASSFGVSLGEPPSDIFSDVAFELREGGAGLITGPSGSGKTALGMAVCRFLPLWAGRFGTRGSVEMFGLPVIQGEDHPGTGLVLENPYTQLSGLKTTVAGELAFPLECAGTPRGSMEPIIGEWAARFGIDHLLPRRVRTLSGGELQRLLIAAALVTRPRFLFLDRPLTEIDDGFRAEIMRTIRSHLRKTGGAALVAEEPELLAGGEPFDTVIRLGEAKEPGTGKSTSLPRTGAGAARAAPSGGLLRVDNLRFAWPGGADILDGVSFSLDGGSVTFLSGPNGAGKSTLASFLAGVRAPTGGDISLGGRSYRTMTPNDIAGRVGLAFQNAALHICRSSVRDEFSLAGRWGRPVGALVEILGLDRLLDIHPLELTQGERKRLAAALAGGGNKDVVILDEPSQYQDGAGVRLLADGISHLAGKGTAVLLITHDPRLRAAFPEAKEIHLG